MGGDPDETVTDEKTTINKEKLEGDPDETVTDEKTTINKEKLEDEICPDIKKWLLGGSTPKNGCGYTASGCTSCHGDAYRCQFRRSSDCLQPKKVQWTPAVQKLVNMKIISDKEKATAKSQLREISKGQTWVPNVLHCCEKKGKIRTKIRKTTKKTVITTVNRDKTTPKKDKDPKNNKKTVITTINRDKTTPKKEPRTKKLTEKTTIKNQDQDTEKKKREKKLN